MKTELTCESDLRRWIKEWLPKKTSRQVITLDGPMGVGKTKFVQLLCEELGVHDEASSPSFAIHTHYLCADSGIDHLDLYRLESEEDLESTGFWDLFSQPSGLIVIEWAERLRGAKLDSRWSQLRIRLEFLGAHTSGHRILRWEVV